MCFFEEAKQDQYGKIYYVDHNSQRSQWEHPNNVAIQTTTVKIYGMGKKFLFETAVSNVKQEVKAPFQVTLFYIFVSCFETCGHTPQTCGKKCL